MCLILRVLFSALLSVFCLLPYSISSASSICLTEQEARILEDNLNELETNNSKLLKLWDEQEQELILLRGMSQKQSRLLMSLQTDLQGCKLNLTLAKQSLRTAQKELDSALQSYKRQEHKETRLRRQRNFWTMIAGSLAVGLAAAMATR